MHVGQCASSCLHCRTLMDPSAHPFGSKRRELSGQEERGKGGVRGSEGLLAGLDLVFWATAHVKRLKERCVAAGAVLSPGPAIGPSTTHVIAPRSMSVSAIASHLAESDPVRRPSLPALSFPILPMHGVCACVVGRGD